MAQYAAFTFDHTSRDALLQVFSPKYANVFLDHITIEYPCDDEAVLFTPENVIIEGYVDDGNGIEALLVRIDGDIYKDNGLPWHITLSLDKTQTAPEHLQDKTLSDKTLYAPAMSNTLLKLALDGNNTNYSIEYLDAPIPIVLTPKILGRDSDKSKAEKENDAQIGTPSLD